MLTKKRDRKRLSLNALAISFCLIPVIKMAISLIHNALPWYLLPFILACVFAGFQFKIYSKKYYQIVTFLFLIYSIPQLILSGTADFIVIKYIVASFISLSFASILWTAFEDKECWYSFLKFIFPLLRYSSLFIFLICIKSLAMAQAMVQTRWPLFHSWSEWIDLLSFSRSNIALRNNIIAGSNFALVMTEDYSLTLMQGPQLLIYPLLHLTLASLFPKAIRVRIIDWILHLLLILGVLMLNSRAMLLYLILLMINKYVRGKEKAESFSALLLMPFPVLITFLGNHLLNGRMAHIRYVFDHINLFGHGIGGGVHDMAQMPESLHSYTFDSIHLEILQYFGILGYLAFASLFLYFIIIRKCNGRFYITFVVFVFLALNFNLFDPYFILPVMLLLTQPKVEGQGEMQAT